MNVYFPTLLIVIGVVFAVIPHVAEYSLSPDALDDSKVLIGPKWSVTAGGLLYALVGAWMYGMFRPRFPKELLPDEFRSGNNAGNAEESDRSRV